MVFNTTEIIIDGDLQIRSSILYMHFRILILQDVVTQPKNIILMNARAIQVAIACYSGRQTTTALCTAMAETIALAKVVVKVKYL